MVGVLEYTNTDPDATLNLTGQGEYTFNEMVVGTLGFVYYDDSNIDGIDIVLGVETYPTEQLCVYLDYTIPEDDADDNNAYLGVCYSF